jgi:membrane fusion protein (multidrug efflux system)
VAGAAVVVPRWVDGQRAPAPPAAADEAAPPLPVDVVRLEPRLLVERLSTTGTLRANESVDVVSEVTGIAREIHFREGSRVERGALLVKIDDTELQAQRERVAYRLRLAEIREARQRELRDQGITSEQEYDSADNERNVLRAEQRLVDAALQKTEIRAPFAGVVGLRYVSAGELLSPQRRITTLQDLDSLKVDFTLPERYATRIRPNQRVEFRVEGSDRAYEAAVYAVEPRIVAETRSLLIRARTPNPDRTLLPGAFADVRLAVEEVPDALVVPSLAVIPELGGKKVFVVEEGRAQARRVETGIRTDTEVQLTSGVAAGETVVVSAIQRLEPGLAVEPRPAPPAGGAP